MSKKCSSEEKFPLLLLYLDDGFRSSKQNRKILIDKGRYENIASGASTVMIQWPGHVTSCWITASLIGLSIFLVSMMMLTFSPRPGLSNLTTKCRINSMPSTNESSTIHLVHDSGCWTKIQLDALEEIARNNSQFQIKLILIRNEIDAYPQLGQCNHGPVEDLRIDTKTIRKRDVGAVITEKTEAASTMTELPSPSTNRTVHMQKKKVTTKSLHRKKAYKVNISAGTKKLLDFLFVKPPSRMVMRRESRRNSTIQDLLRNYPNIKVINSTYEHIFKTSPLHLFWHHTNQKTRLFAIRVLQLWNFGGIALSFPDFEPLCNTNENSAKSVTPTPENWSKYKEMVRVGTTTFESLPVGLVTIDDEGSRMATKTICHALFGEFLIALTKTNRSTMPCDVIRETLRKLCLKGSVNANYCKTLTV